MDTYSAIGKQIFDRIPASKAPYWGSLLLSALKQLGLIEPREVSDLRILINSTYWEKTKEQFSKIRDLTISNSDKQKELYLLIAEKISKITYNQTDTIACFDSDSGYYIYQLVLQIIQSIDLKDEIDKIEGVLNLFETEKHSKNYFAIETYNSFQSLTSKIFKSKKEEFVKLRSELPIHCTHEEIDLTNPKSKLHRDSEIWPNGSFEFQFDIKFKEHKIGYYALIWSPEIELQDELYVLNK